MSHAVAASKRLPLKPVCGSIFKRKGGKYLSVRSEVEAPFWFEFTIPGGDGAVQRIALRTTDPALALLRANALVWKSHQFAEEIFLRGKLTPRPHSQGGAAAPEFSGCGAVAPRNPRSLTVEKALEPRVSLAKLWENVKTRYDARAKSLEAYRQQTVKFAKYALDAGLHYADEVTRPFAEDYARWLFPRVTTADKHIGCLRREWQLLFPDAPANPWNLSIRLQKKEKDRAMNYRALTCNEIRRVRQTLERLRLDKSLLPGRARMLDDALLSDMADAIVFCYHYGLRIGSVGVIRWEDFDLADKTWSHRPPKTSRATLGNDYPLLPEIEAILAHRRAEAGGHPRGPLFPAFARVHASAEQLFNLTIKAVFKLARVEDSPLKGRATWHSFRATFITRLTENGCPEAIVKELAQHVRADVTQRYVHISMGVKLKWLQTLPDLGTIDLSANYSDNPELSVRQ